MPNWAYIRVQFGARQTFYLVPISPTMKRVLARALLVASAAYADPRKFAYDCEAWAEGEPPKEVFVVEGKINVVAKDGNKALEIGVGELVDSNALLGDSANGSASIETRVFGSKQGRSMPKFGVGVHGQSGYRLMVFAAQ